MSDTRVVSLQAVRKARKAREANQSYQARISNLEKLELLEEMMRFQEERSKLGRLTSNMMTEGQILFKVLEEKAETQELRYLARSYRRHLKYELAALGKESIEYPAPIENEMDQEIH